MYNHHLNAVGVAGLGDEPSLWDSFLNLAKTGVQAGFNIYSNVQNLTQAQKTAQQAQAQAAQAQQYAQMVQTAQAPGAYGQQMSQPGFMDTWGLPLVIGGVAIGAFVLLRK